MKGDLCKDGGCYVSGQRAVAGLCSWMYAVEGLERAEQQVGILLGSS